MLESETMFKMLPRTLTHAENLWLFVSALQHKIINCINSFDSSCTGMNPPIFFIK